MKVAVIGTGLNGRMAIRVCQLYGVSVDAFTVDGPLETIDYKRFMTSPLAPFADSGLWQGPGP